MNELSSESQLINKDSFTLVGSVVTSLGKPDTQNRNKRVFATIEKLHKLRSAPLRFELRVRLAGAIFKSAIFGSELVQLTHGLFESLRSGIVYTLWRGKSWLRCWATTATPVVPVHILHPRAASIYHTLTLMSRLLRRRMDLRAIFENHYENYPEQFITGPFAVLSNITHSLNLTRHSPFQFYSQEGTLLDLLDPDVSCFHHNLRSCLRAYVLKNNTADGSRLDMRGGPLLAYDCNVLLIQKRNKKLSAQLSLFDLSQLRNILTGAVHTQERKFKAKCAPNDICPWCDQNIPESVEHLFWVCPTWQHLRIKMIEDFADILPTLPPCVRECGLFPQNLLNTGPFTLQFVQTLVPKIQLMMISILQERNSKIRQEPKKPKPIVEPFQMWNTVKKSEQQNLEIEVLFPQLSLEFRKKIFHFPKPASKRLFLITGGYIKLALNGYLESELSIRSTGIGPICNGQLKM